METNASKKMDFNWGDVKEHLPVFFGSFLYFLYMRVFQNVEFKKSVVALLTGCLVATYWGGPIGRWLWPENEDAVVFLVSFLGMKLMDGIVHLDIKGLLRKWVERPLK